jgi:periplasmic protein CpxP/Spy
MTAQTHSASPSPDAPDQPPRRRRGRTALFAVLIAAASGLTGATAANAFDGYGPGGWRGPGPWHGRGFMMRPFDPAQAAERADHMVRHLAVEVDATAEQEQKLRAVVKGLVKDVLPMREHAETARARARNLLTQPKIDRAAIEAFRTEQMALADKFTTRVAQALADAAEILTPEQRRKLAEMLPPHRRGFWRGGSPG